MTVAVRGSTASGWDVTYASSSLARDSAVAGDYSLSPEQAWVQAANAVGEQVSTSDVQVTGHKEGWTELKVDGFHDKQSVRKSTFPVPGKQARASFQTLVSDGDDVGYAQTVDAATGEILARTNTVDNVNRQPGLEGVPRLPADVHAERVPVELLQHGHAPALVLDADLRLRPLGREHGELGRRCDAVGPDRSRGAADVQDVREQRELARELDHGRAGPPGRHVLPADERDARLRLPVDEHVVHVGLQPVEPRRRDRGSAHGHRQRHLGGGREPVRDAQPDARLGVRARLHRDCVERPAEQLHHAPAVPRASPARTRTSSGARSQNAASGSSPRRPG